MVKDEILRILFICLTLYESACLEVKKIIAQMVCYLRGQEWRDAALSNPIVFFFGQGWSFL